MSNEWYSVDFLINTFKNRLKYMHNNEKQHRLSTLAEKLTRERKKITDHQHQNWFSNFHSGNASLQEKPRHGSSSELDQDTISWKR